MKPFAPSTPHTASAISRRQALAAGAAVLASPWPGAASAQAYPGKPIRFIVPYGAGGSTDNIARIIGEKLGARLGQPVVVENRLGAGGILGTDAVAKAAPDGYTFAVTLSTSLLINQFLYEKLPYNTLRDLALVSELAAAPVTLVVHPSVTANTGPELMRYIAANRNKLSYGSYGIGSYAHLAGAHMSLAQNAEMAHAAYKGESLMIQDLIGGQIQMAFASAQASKPHIDSGRLKVIGVTGMKRMAVLPKVPTLLEQGLKDEAYQVVGFIGMAAPAKTPHDIVQRIAKEVQSICELPEVAEKISNMGFTVSAGTPEAFLADYKKDLPVWERMVKQSGAKLD